MRGPKLVFLLWQGLKLDWRAGAYWPEGLAMEVACMRNWLLAFRPDTYEKVRSHQIIGVLKNHRKRFAELSDGDRFVVYLSKKCLFDAHGIIQSAPFEDQRPIFGEGQLYPHRCRVQFLSQGAAKPVGDTLWYLDAFKELNNTTPANVLLCRGGFVAISDRDYTYLTGLMAGTVLAQPIRWED